MSSAAILKLNDLPPSTNRLWRYVAGRAIKSELYRSWLKAVAWEIAAQRETPVVGPYDMRVLVNRPDKRRRDLSNFVKSLEYALVTAGMVEDDSLCQRLSVEWVNGADWAVKVFITSTLER